ncbi:MAG: hypothetical protein V2B19_28550 [Pseudomonadota bacterium]
MRNLWFVWLAAVVSGCIPYSDHPLTAPDTDGPDPAILGSWGVHDDGETVCNRTVCFMVKREPGKSSSLTRSMT